jgi:hypothetical protein
LMLTGTAYTKLILQHNSAYMLSDFAMVNIPD